MFARLILPWFTFDQLIFFFQLSASGIKKKKSLTQISKTEPKQILHFS